jgi:hypothetical protein
VSADRFLELVPLAALDALDGEDLVQFRDHVAGCHDCRRELPAHQKVAGLIATAADPVPPPPALRVRTMAAAGIAVAPSRRRAWLPLAAAAAFAALAGVIHLDRNAARRDAEQARAGAEQERTRAQQEGDAMRARLGEQDRMIALLTHRDTRMTVLAAAPAGAEPMGRVLWNPTSRRAVLMAEGLPAVPPGKAYEVWVIADGAPRAAGVFRPDAQGRAVVTLPDVAETARARTFAVTLEPEAGVPAPTGPMVLAGAVS